MFRFVRIPVVAFVAVVLGACGDGTTTPQTQTPVPANVTKQAGDNQTAEPDAAVATPPSVRVTTSAGEAVEGVTVTFAVASGGGSVTGANATTNADGVATVGSWKLGTAEGENSLTATVTGSGINGNPATFTATAQFPSFNPNANTSLSGTRNYSTLTIPAGITITATGPLTINVSGNASIAGTITGDCQGIEVRVDGNLTVDGLIQNSCSTESATAPGIKLLADGELTIGTTASAQDAIVSDGSIRITDAATENLAITPLSPFLQEVRLDDANAAAPLFAKAQSGATRANRPVRAGRGQDATITRNGPIDIANLFAAGDGKDADAKTQAGICDNSTAIGGTGGRVQLVAVDNTLTFKAGAIVRSGNGGKGGSCTAPTGCPATALAGKGGIGGSLLIGAQNIVFEANVELRRGNGGAGGDAIATADAGTGSCANGCNATATGGEGGGTGGIGYAVLEPGTINGVPSESGADGGTGGLAEATGGDGQDCDVCPQGNGGQGGTATATGGRGGNGATGNVFPMAANSHLRGNGGMATAFGGNGGDGADCCEPNPEEGGNGGDGGNATATGGEIGLQGAGGNGTRGATGGMGGTGGDGGEGSGPGDGGARGTGTGVETDIPDGEVGAPGLPCPEIEIEILPLQLIGNASSIVELHVTATRINFFSPIDIIIRDAENTVRGTGQIPSDETQLDVLINLPETVGTSNYTATASGPGVQSVVKEFQVTVNPPPPPQPDELDLDPQPAGVQGSVPPNTYTWNLVNTVTQAVEGVMNVIAGGNNGGHFRAENPRRIGTAPGSWWMFDLGTAFVNDLIYQIESFSMCIINSPNISADNPLVVEHLNGNDEVTKADVFTQQGCVEIQVAPDTRKLKKHGLKKNGFADASKKKVKRRKN